MAGLSVRPANRSSVRRSCRAERRLTRKVMLSFAFPRVNRAGPRARQRPPWTPVPNRGRRKIVRERANQAAVPGVAPASLTGLSALCLLTQLASGTRGRQGGGSHCHADHDQEGRAGACADVNSPAPGRPVRSPPPARRPLKGVRTPAFARAPCCGRQEFGAAPHGSRAPSMNAPCPGRCQGTSNAPVPRPEPMVRKVSLKGK